ncbi:hypothetical protein NPIL_216001 [Nephila pilipes]|uniref:Uncharacterized protein n=1 Tax=Nephila pilipes TaxID=299642 RepID=A0A8X6TH94_NEPPI|nr:hypothetical protein NPIL_216001 [Nephila pilipes]
MDSSLIRLRKTSINFSCAFTLTVIGMMTDTKKFSKEAELRKMLQLNRKKRTTIMFWDTWQVRVFPQSTLSPLIKVGSVRLVHHPSSESSLKIHTSPPREFQGSKSPATTHAYHCLLWKGTHSKSWKDVRKLSRGE